MSNLEKNTKKNLEYTPLDITIPFDEQGEAKVEEIFDWYIEEFKQNNCAIDVSLPIAKDFIKIIDVVFLPKPKHDFYVGNLLILQRSFYNLWYTLWNDVNNEELETPKHVERAVDFIVEPIVSLTRLIKDSALKDGEDIFECIDRLTQNNVWIYRNNTTQLHYYYSDDTCKILDEPAWVVQASTDKLAFGAVNIPKMISLFYGQDLWDMTKQRNATLWNLYDNIAYLYLVDKKLFTLTRYDNELQKKLTPNIAKDRV